MMVCWCYLWKHPATYAVCSKLINHIRCQIPKIHLDFKLTFWSNILFSIKAILQRSFTSRRRCHQRGTQTYVCLSTNKKKHVRKKISKALLLIFPVVYIANFESNMPDSTI